MNRVFVIGNLTKDPETRATGSGVSVCNFTIAVNRRFKNANGETETDYLHIVAWRQLGDLCGRYLAKGRKVAVTGSIQTRQYDAKDGTKRTAWDIVADEVEFLTPQNHQSGTDSFARRREKRRAAIPKRSAREAAGQTTRRSRITTTAGSPRWTTTSCRFKQAPHDKPKRSAVEMRGNDRHKQSLDQQRTSKAKSSIETAKL